MRYIESHYKMYGMPNPLKKKKKKILENRVPGTSPAVQWLRLQASTAVGAGSIPGRGTKIPQATWCGQK